MVVRVRLGAVVVVLLLTTGWIAGFFSGLALGYDRRSGEVKAWKRQTAECVVEAEKQRQFLVPLFGRPRRLQ